MLEGLGQVDGGAATLPFVRMFHGSPSQCLWDDDNGVTHTIPQGEGGDAMMPLLFSKGQHGALETAHRNLREGEFLFAFHNDVVGDSPRPCWSSLCCHAGLSVASRRDQDPCW